MITKIGSISSFKYPTTIIGTQEWMTTNLSTEYYNNGDIIPYVEDFTEWATTTQGAWCWYNNDPSYNNKIGKLYNFWAVIDPRGIAPEGFRIPTYEDVLALNINVDGPCSAGDLKMSGSTTNWDSPNVAATNKYGFFADSNGIRSFEPFFFNLTTSFTFWVNRNGIPYIFGLNNKYISAAIDQPYPISIKNRNYGFGIRCLKGPSITTSPTYSAYITFSTY